MNAAAAIPPESRRRWLRRILLGLLPARRVVVDRPPEHDGIRLRIRVVVDEHGTHTAPLVELDSDYLYNLAVLGGSDSWCGFACPPGCTEHGWTNLMTTRDTVVEIKPVRLACDHR